MPASEVVRAPFWRCDGPSYEYLIMFKIVVGHYELLRVFIYLFIYLFQIFIQGCLFSQRLVFHRALCHKIQYT